MYFVSEHTDAINETCCEQPEHKCVVGSFNYIPTEFYQDLSTFDKVMAKLKKRARDLLDHSAQCVINLKNNFKPFLIF